MKMPVFLVAVTMFAALQVRAQEPDLHAEAERFSQMYFAPMDGANFFRLYVPETGMVEFRKDWRTGGLMGAGGWRAERGKDKGDITVRAPGSQIAYTFRKGRPFCMEDSGGKKLQMQFESEPTILGTIPSMWDGAKEEALEMVARKWPTRFSLFYVNPNHSAVLFAELALLSLFVFLYFRRPYLVGAGAVGFAASVFLLLKTEGRGGALALAVGAVLLIGFRFFRQGGKVRLFSIAALAIAVFAFLCIGGNVGRISFSAKNGGDAMSNSARIEKWRHVPRMMVEAPNGWGATRPGRAYSDWYQPLSSSAVTPTLDSDHLTYMTGFGWKGRFLWVFCWAALLLSLIRFAVRGGTSLPAALFFALGVAAMFNPLLHKLSLWAVPVASLLPVAQARPWRNLRDHALPLTLAAAVALSVCAVFFFVGRAQSLLAVPSIHADGNRVCVGSKAPQIWVADDRYSLGWLFAPKEIRHFYSAYPGAAPIGYTDDLVAVPARVGRLAVAGRLCREYINRWKKGKAPIADELIFLSPGMPFRDVPYELRKRCRLSMVVGEFAARYAEVYGKLDTSNGVVLTEGSEVYLPGWVGLILTW